ncbi:hypothetical protein CORC01_12073 [Colletotrichum orchidophilum]|uniref:Uncharacterized protein n=1 Tax=Colletotrichum orchidophilum TaxID=1209926 RepID=A0A1G4ATY5_9PEZI|nr:uncharacterized protein CORC01_12073 [Colletotrichum orchidophilum]OHE92627.1 hypothetical protein CORC01_12073 [Colletotrichum orchidophilum]
MGCGVYLFRTKIKVVGEDVGSVVCGWRFQAWMASNLATTLLLLLLDQPAAPETETTIALESQTASQENIRPTHSTTRDHRQVSSYIYPIRRQFAPPSSPTSAPSKSWNRSWSLNRADLIQLYWGVSNQRGRNTNPLNAIAAVLDLTSRTQSFTTTKQIDTLALESI